MWNMRRVDWRKVISKVEKGRSPLAPRAVSFT